MAEPNEPNEHSHLWRRVTERHHGGASGILGIVRNALEVETDMTAPEYLILARALVGATRLLEGAASCARNRDEAPGEPIPS